MNKTTIINSFPKSREYQLAEQLFAQADIHINGNREGDIQVHNPQLFKRIFTESSLGLGEAYMDEWWDCNALDVFFYKILTAKLHTQIKVNFRLIMRVITNLLFNMQTKKLSLRVANAHYNLDNELYSYMLGETMSYTCGYWKNAQTLEQAQDNKHDLVCRKLELKSSDRVLELGCGWGSFAKFAASHYGCKIVSINISNVQIENTKKICKDLPVTAYLCDYRDIHIYNPKKIEFDKVVSIGMCEHVGYKNYPLLMHIANHNLKKNGLFLLHTIGGNRFTTQCEPWTNKYIFPGGVLPSISGLGAAIENKFIMEDWHNFGAYYDPTLIAWHKNFVSHWDKLKDRYDQRFYRMWTYYLLSCAGMFRARSAQLWQLVLSKDGVIGGYESVR